MPSATRTGLPVTFVSSGVLLVLVLLLLSGASGAIPWLTPGATAHGAAREAAPAAAGLVTGPVTPAGSARQPSGAPGEVQAAGTERTTAYGTPAWTNITDLVGNPPPYRSYGRSFTYDPVDHYLVLFGGDGGAGYLADTWVFNGTWTQLHPATSPSARDHGTLAWDPLDGYVLMFGGSGDAGAYADTWTFLHGNWTLLNPQTHPSARWGSSMTWDAGDQEMVLFGGCAGLAVGDTWTYVAGNWTKLNTTTAPSDRENTALRYDPTMNATILFSGDNYAAATYGDTWEFKAGNWTQLNESVAPGPRSMASFGYDAAIGGMVLFGGSNPSGGTYGDTWWFINGTWSEQFPATPPAPRYFGELAAYPVDQGVVLYGGDGPIDATETWSYTGFVLNASSTNESGEGPLTATFNASASNASGSVAYAWNFGDGNMSTTENTTHVYVAVGEYYVTLSATDGNGSVAKAAFVVRVASPLAATAIVAPSIGTVPLSVDCSVDPSGGLGPYTVSWSAGAGANSSFGANATFTYGAPGNFTAAVTVVDASGTHWSEQFPVQVRPAVVAPLTSGIVASATSGPAPLLVWFSGTAGGGVGADGFSWAFGDGSVSGAGPTVSHVFTVAGVAVSTLTVTDARGITSSSNVTVTVGAALAALGSAPARTVAGINATFQAAVSGGLPPYQLIWAFGDGTAAVAGNVTHQYADPGTFNATLTVTDHRGVLVSSSSSVVVSAAPYSPPKNPPTGSSGGSGASLDDADVLALAILGGAAMIAVAAIVVRRIDNR
ncbi:MAG TPA: PKD domain-containing protein [Thermoplasmata archaeon]|nr:PKD domain-containing protein [Thermoplasmata archaeon]